jgi:hypothetical protein
MTKLKLLTMAELALALLAIPGTAMAKSRDRDRDHMADRWEKRHHLNTHRKDGSRDPDRDGVSNLREFRHHTNPRDADTNDDGVGDGGEVAGTIANFDAGTGVLTITTANGDVTGTVTGSTEIKCETEGEQEDAGDDHGDDRSRVSAARHGSDDNGEEDNACTTADLTQGTRVHEAERNGDGQFGEIELQK